VAAVYDGTNIYLYVDGTLDVSTPATGLMAQDSYPVCLGEDPDAPHPYYFNGLIDAVSLYNRALSAAEIQTIYLAGSEGKCPMPLAITTQPANETVGAGGPATFAVVTTGMQPLNYQWNFNGSNLAWATNSVLSLTNVQPVNAGAYAVTVTNLYGSVTSSNAVLTVLTQAPTITTQPTNEAVNAGSTATLAVVATGTPPLNYQWSFNAANLIGATNNVLTLANVQPINGGIYSVTVTNLYGLATSSNAVLTVLTYPPTITTQPVSQTNVVDATVIFSITAGGTAPLNYQWSFDATNIVGATNSSLILTNIQVAQTGNYSVLVTNAYGATNSAIAVLTLIPVESCDPPPPGLVSWWTGNGNATDINGTNNGTWIGTATYTNGEVGQAFSVSTINYISIPDSPSLDQFTTAFTLEFWEKGPSPNNNWNSMVSKSDSGYEVRLYYDQNYANFYVNGLSNDGVVGTRNVNDGKWHHIAGVYDGTNCYLYVDGTLDAKQANTGTINCAQGTALGIGWLPTPNYPRNFTGLIDEVSLYKVALSSNQIAAIYDAGSAGKCLPMMLPTIISQPTNQVVAEGAAASFSVTAAGSTPLSYQWMINGTNILGGTNTTLLLTNVQSSQAGIYAMWVTNQYGSILSSNALLTVLGPPIITQQPVSETNFVGTTATFTVTATGSQPLRYQWLFDGSPIVGNQIISTVAGKQSLGGGYSGDGGAATNAGLNYAEDVAVDSTGNLYIDDSHNDVIRKVNGNGIISTVAGNNSLGRGYSGDGGAATNATLNYPNGVAVDGQGNLYIADSVNNVIRKINASGIITTVAGNASQGAGYSGDGGAATNATLNSPIVVRVDTAGNLYIADVGNNVIRKVNTSGIITTVAGNYSLGGGYSGDGGAATNAALNQPHGVVLDGTGNLYVSEGGNNVVRKVNAAGIISTVAGKKSLGGGYSGDGGAATNAALNNPIGITIDSAGNLFIAEYGNNVVRRVDATGTISTVVGSHNLGGGYSGDGSAATNAALNNPIGVALDGSGNLYIGDAHNNVIRKVAAAISNATMTNGTLTITNVQNYDAGTFQVIVTNAVGAVTSSNAVLTVLSMPVITSQPANETVAAGNTATFSVTALGTPPLNYQWTFNGTNILGGTNTTLLLTNVQSSQAGNYAVWVTNQDGVILSSNALLTVLGPPIITQQPVSETNFVGTTATFTVTATG